jgi:hypothetical protein
MCFSYSWTCYSCVTNQSFRIWCQTRRCSQPSYMGTVPDTYNPRCQNCANPRHTIPRAHGQQSDVIVRPMILNKPLSTLAQPECPAGFTPIDSYPTARRANLFSTPLRQDFSNQSSELQQPSQAVPQQAQSQQRRGRKLSSPVQSIYQRSISDEIPQCEPRIVTQPCTDAETQLDGMEWRRDELLDRLERATEHAKGVDQIQKRSEGHENWTNLLFNLRVANHARRNRSRDGPGDPPQHGRENSKNGGKGSKGDSTNFYFS